MAVAAAFQLFDGLQAVAAGALRGLQDTRTPMLIRAVRLLGPGTRHRGVARLLHSARGLGIWIGLAVGLIVVALLMLQRWAAALVSDCCRPEHFSCFRRLTPASPTHMARAGTLLRECQFVSPT
jgi:hypothetical protein